MNMPEYLHAVTGQIRCKQARAMVESELRNHIEDQMSAYMDNGMEAERAETEAVRQMGDAVCVGLELDRIHRPRLDARTLILMAVISLVGVIMQTTINRICSSNGIVTGDVRDVIFQIVLGIIVMCGILFADYTFIGKYPFVLWGGSLLVFVLDMADFSLPFGNVFHQAYFFQNLCLFCLFGLILPAYAGIIYHYRSKGFLGLLLSLLWLIPGFFLSVCATERLFYCMTVFAGCFLLLVIAVSKGLFNISKSLGLLTVWGSVLGGILCSCAVFFPKNSYRIARLKSILGKFLLWNSDQISYEENYISLNIRNSLNNIPLAGKNTTLAQFPQEDSLSFFLLLNEYGSIAGIIMTAVLLLLFCFMLRGIRKQKNILGSLLGIACLLGILLPALIHIFSNLSLFTYAEMYLPFFYPGYVANICCYGLTGLYLSVYRYTDVVA